MNYQDIILAFGLTMIAGLSTGIGSLIAFFATRTDTRFLSASLGLSAGVMIYVSFMELMPESVSLLGQLYPERMASFYMLLAFFSGIALIAIIDWLVPEDENPHELHSESDQPAPSRLKRTGIMMALAIGIHNFPEGLAIGSGFESSLKLGLSLAIAICLHDVPEGISMSIPMKNYYRFYCRLSAKANMDCPDNIFSL